MFDEILSEIGFSDSTAPHSNMPNIGVMQVLLPFDALSKLYSRTDARILSIELNKPLAKSALTNSTNLMNLAPAWSGGIRAAGQYIVVVDSGVRKNHALFTTSGTTRVVYEACFGTNAVSDGITYSTICPSPDGLGDSTPGLVNSGEPLSFTNLTACVLLGEQCYHGTHVAGIAAGRQNALVTPSNLQGVGPDAFIVAAQVFSFKTTSPQNAVVFEADILKALDTVLGATTPGTVDNSFTVNMSLGGAGLSFNNCDTTPISINNVVLSLTSVGVPVIAATGNNGAGLGIGSKTHISWPACVPYVIKVSSVRNDTTGTTLSSFANIANQSSFVGPILLAPGGGDGTSIQSAVPTATTATMSFSGTSQAAPHVASAYAMLKGANPGGISVADATAWFITTGSIPVTVNLPAPYGNQDFRRLRLP